MPPRITQDVDLIVDLLKSGEVAAIPTETVYGLAAAFNHETAIKKIFSIKKRPLTHPLIVHIADDSQLADLAINIPTYVDHLTKNFWPGPLTLVLFKSAKINHTITAGAETVAIRCPDHPLTLELIHKLGRPIVAPSANPFNKISPTTAEHVLTSFAHEDFYVLDGGRCNVGIESTIVDARHHDHYQILRHGALTQQNLAAHIDIPYVESADAPVVSGALKNHYQPHIPLHYFQTQEEFIRIADLYDNNVYAIHFSNDFNFTLKANKKLPCDPQKMAHALYFELRAAETEGNAAIVIELPPNNEQWQAIRDKIIKASSPLLRHS